MKTLKFALVAAFFSFALVGYSTDYNDTEVRSLKISLDEAMDDRGLVRQMYIQLDEDFLKVKTTKLYSASVKYHKSIYVIYGTQKEWELFFLMDNHVPGGANSAIESQSSKAVKVLVDER